MKISLFYKNVTVLDYAYLDDHRGVVGDALRVHVEFIGKTDEEGVVYDFSYAKKKVKEIIDRDCDHRLVVPQGLAEVNDKDVAHFSYKYGLADQELRYTCPSEGLCIIPSFHVDKQTISTYLENTILKEMPETVTAIKITLEDESFAEAKPTFHYTHALKEHYGNCQRLFHGHKNTVDVEVNGQVRTDLEEYLCEELFQGNVHFCKWENVVNKDEISKATGMNVPTGRFHEIPKVEIAYTSAQGKFEGVLPGREVFFMEQESTVENLSMLFAKLVRSKIGPAGYIRVSAYEGIAKGAITSL